MRQKERTFQVKENMFEVQSTESKGESRGKEGLGCGLASESVLSKPKTELDLWHGQKKVKHKKIEGKPVVCMQRPRGKVKALEPYNIVWVQV